MNYTKIYNQIISNSQSRSDPVTYEKHHIIPRCLGGSNAKSNIVKLSPREHFVCHLLLAKMYSGEQRKKMLFAFRMMCYGPTRSHNDRYRPSSHLYQNLKSQANQLLSARPISEKTKRLISEKAKGRPSSFKGKTHSEQSLRKMSEVKRGKPQHANTKKALDAFRENNKAKHLHTPAIAKRISDAKRLTSPLVGKFTIYHPDGTKEHSEDLFSWCENTSFSISTVRHLLKTGLTAKQGPLRGFSFKVTCS